MKKAVIFDMDGLLIDSEPLWNKALRKLIEKYGNPKKYFSTGNAFLGMKQEAELQYLLDREILSGDLKYLADRRIDLVIGIMNKNLQMLPGALALLENLSKQGYIMALASSSPKVVIDYVVKKLKIKKYFTVIISGDSVRLGKPDPEIYLLTSKKLDIKPEYCIVLEDAPNGIKAANTAGMKTVGVVNKFADRKALGGADIIINNLFEFNLELLR